MKQYKITVTGKVQGVFFRNSARESAESLGLTGLARNEPDGSVYIEVEGDNRALKQFLEWCYKGPEGAAVEDVTHIVDSAAGRQGFSIY